MENFVLPIGLKINDENILEVPIAETGGDAEKIYTKKPSPTGLYSWFGKVLSVSIDSIGKEEVAKPYIAQQDKNNIPEVVKKIPLVDVGSLLIQVQRECWEDLLENQRIVCRNCGAELEASIDLNRIDIPNADKPEREAIEYFTVSLPKTYTIDSGGIEQLEEYNGLKFNKIRFRVATLSDGIKHEAIGKDELMFWQNIAFDTMDALIYEEGDVVEEVPKRYITLRGKQLFNKDFNTKTLKVIRSGLQTELPSAKNYYEEECPECNKNTPFFASVGSFFMV